MSEGPEVRRTADRIAEVLLGRKIEAVELRKWRTYARSAFDAGKARPPPSVRWRGRGDAEQTRRSPRIETDDSLRADEERAFLAEIRRMLRTGYEEAGRTRPLAAGEAANRWDFKHWVFRRSGRPSWRCGDRIQSDRSSSARVTDWCPTCQSGESVAPGALRRRA